MILYSGTSLRLLLIPLGPHIEMDIEMHGRMHPNSDKLFYCVGLVYYYTSPLIIGLPYDHPHPLW